MASMGRAAGAEGSLGVAFAFFKGLAYAKCMALLVASVAVENVARPVGAIK